MFCVLSSTYRPAQAGSHVGFALLGVVQRIRDGAQVLLHLSLIKTAPLGGKRLLCDLSWIDSGIQYLFWQRLTHSHDGMRDSSKHSGIVDR